MRCVALTLFLLVLGCAPKPAQSPVAPDHDACRLVASGASPLDTLIVPLLDPVDRDNALSPANDSELLLYRMTLDTPLRLDCQGQALPGLARSWDKDSTGRVWTFTLKDEARRYYPDSPVSAHQVVAAWNERGAVKGSLALQSAVALDGRRIAVTLRRPQDSVPKILADPAFAIAIDPAHRPPGVKFEIQTGMDPRDALDRGAGLVVTRDPALVDYVAERPEFAAFPLPWSRTYVLLQPAAAESLDLVRDDAGRSSLARDAVSADARAAESPFWWTEVATCPAGGAGPAPTSSRVVYIRGDEVARGLAERVVALAGPGTGLRAAALEAAHFATLLRTGSDRAYVVALPRHTLAPCREATWPDGARIQPLIDTRAYAIVRRGAPSLTVDWDGTVRVAPQ